MPFFRFEGQRIAYTQFRGRPRAPPRGRDQAAGRAARASDR